jgi:arylsulfatase A-like enzyme
VQRAGIDHLVTGTDLGGLEQEQIGAPDERATEEALSFVRALRTESQVEIPYFAVVHLSNTHAPYRFDPALQPFLPSAAQGLGDIESFHNRYRNSVRMQERTVAAFLDELRALPGWQDTVVLFLSDHGEQFREHGGLFHNHSLFDEELRVPGWLYAGTHALTSQDRRALGSYAGKRTYTEDVHATLVDLFGLHDARGLLPLAPLVAGRSLLHPWSEGAPGDHEPSALLATSTAVWEPDDARFGAMRGDRVIVSSAAREWVCFDLQGDPGEHKPLPAGQCGGLEATAKAAFGGEDGRPPE